MPTYFIITALEGNWTWQDFLLDGMDYEYCSTMLDIPEEAIDYIEVFDESLEIQLHDDPEIAGEDWFIQLITLAKIGDVSA